MRHGFSLPLPVICILVAALCLPMAALAQKPKSKTKPKSDVEIINFGDDSGSSKKSDDKHIMGMILKTSPTSFIFGRQPVELEKEITDYFSLQAGVGITFLPLWAGYSELIANIRDDGSSGYCDSKQWASDECDYYSDLTIRSGKIGPMLSLSGRLFFQSDGYEGMYIAPVLRYSVQNYNVQKVQEGSTSLEHIPGDTQKEHAKNFDLLVHYGGQTLYPKLAVEWFIGAGIRFGNNLRQDVGRDAFGLYGNGERTFKDKTFRLEAGLRVGFQL